MKNWWLISWFIAIGLSASVMAQPVHQERPTLSAEALKEQRAIFTWLLGTWKADHMFGPNSSRTGAVVTFFLESNGTVSARLDKMSPWMEGSEKRFADLVGKRFIRGIHTSGAPRHVWSNSASGGIVFDRNTGNWINLGIISVDRKTGKLSHLGAMSDFSHWVKVSGGSGSNQPAAAPNAPAKSGRVGRNQPKNLTAQADPRTPSSVKKCNYSFYQMLVVGSTGSVIAQFEQDVDEVATYDPDMPSQRMFPSPINGAAEIPVSYMNFADYRALTGMEEITEDALVQGGPDNELASGAAKMRRLFSGARQSYDLSARLADQRRTQCPKFSDPDAYPKIAEADAIMDALRKRRDEVLKPRLAEGDRLNEKLARAFFSNLADASSLDEKQKKFLANLKEKALQELKSRLTGEAIEPKKVEDLVPQLEALRERNSRLASQGKPVSQATRDKNLKEALKKSGIDYDPSLGRTTKRDGRISMGKAGFDYLSSTLGPQITGVGQPFATAQSHFAALKVTVETFNSLKNYYSLMGTRDELLPVALAVQENRAYLAGLVKRYDLLEQEYAIMRGNFENAVTSGGELSETD